MSMLTGKKAKKQKKSTKNPGIYFGLKQETRFRNFSIETLSEKVFCVAGPTTSDIEAVFWQAAQMAANMRSNSNFSLRKT